MKHAIVVFIVIAGALALPGWAHAAVPARAKVTLSARAEVQPARPVAIRDIAKVDGPKELARKISAMTIATGPMPGKSATLGAEFVRLRLKAEAKTTVQVNGPDQVELVGKCLRFSSEKLADSARTLIEDQLPTGDHTYEVVVDRAPREVVVAGGGSTELRPRLLNPMLRPGPIAVVVDVVTDQRTVAGATVGFTVKAMTEVLVATKPIRAGEVITSENTAWDRRDVTRKPDALMRRDRDITGWVARRGLTEGATVLTTDVAPPFTVRRGETATVTVTCGRVTLRTTGEVKQDARIGELVRVRPADSSEDMRATVLGPGQVGVTR